MKCILFLAIMLHLTPASESVGLLLSIQILGDIERWINEHASAAVLRDHLAFLHSKLAALKEHIEKLEKENAKIIKENAELKQRAAGQETSDEFVEERGAAFKRLPSGGYSKTPHCPHCHRTMFSLRGRAPYQCSNKACGHVADLKQAELSILLERLNRGMSDAES